ncbi:MAG: glycosyltransferase family 4 protein [Acidobacteriota bacterium]
MATTIVHIGPSQLPLLYTLGGAVERRMRELAMRQAQAGSRVILYSAESETKTSDYHGAEVRAIACSQKGVVRAGEFLYKSLRDARSVKPDVIHFHSLAEGAACTRLFARGVRAKTVLSFDFFEFRRGKQNPFFKSYRRALNRFSALLPVSGFCQRESSAYWAIPEDRMRVVYNGVSLQQFFPDPESARKRRAAWGIGSEFVALYVGRVCHQKGTDLLIDAYARLREQGRPIRLVIAGPNGQFGQAGHNDAIEKLKQHGGLYLGPVEEADLPSVYNAADVFVMPTRTAEMFGMAAIEAQACGIPVICSDQGGLPEVIDRSSGMLFRPDDVEDLVAKLDAMMANVEMRNGFSNASVDNARRFSWERITSDLDQVYAMDGRA